MTNIYSFWKENESIWFNSKPEDDKKITDLFEDSLKNNIDTTTCNVIEWTEYVILHDQLRRHINRHTNKNYLEPDDLIPSCYVIYNKFKENLSEFDFMWLLMPLRHTHNYTHVSFVIEESWKLLIKTKSPQIKKYIEASYLRYIKLTPDNDKSMLIKYYGLEYNWIKDIKLILDSRCKDYERGDINIITKHNLIDIMDNYLTKYNLKNKTIILSLSGGVDSMVCSYILHILKQKFIAVHINYNNRKECPIEEKLLKYWCLEILSVPLYIRKISEINRPLCMEYEMRNVYEDYTKQIRYSAYINSDDEPYVMLGHNKDDSIENVFTNILTSNHTDNLLGMTEISSQEYKGKNIIFLRPFLNTFKKDLYEFAKMTKTIHLEDSTPTWSQRGMIRDIVIPGLNRWNINFIDNLLKFVNKVSDMYNCINNSIDNKISTYESIHEFPTSYIFWETKFKKMKIHVTQSTLKTFIERILFLQNNEHKLITNVKLKFTLCKDKILFIMKTSDNNVICAIDSK